MEPKINTVQQTLIQAINRHGAKAYDLVQEHIDFECPDSGWTCSSSMQWLLYAAEKRIWLLPKTLVDWIPIDLYSIGLYMKDIEAYAAFDDVAKKLKLNGDLLVGVNYEFPLPVWLQIAYLFCLCAFKKVNSEFLRLLAKDFPKIKIQQILSNAITGQKISETESLQSVMVKETKSKFFQPKKKTSKLSKELQRLFKYYKDASSVFKFKKTTDKLQKVQLTLAQMQSTNKRGRQLIEENKLGEIVNSIKEKELDYDPMELSDISDFPEEYTPEPQEEMDEATFKLIEILNGQSILNWLEILRKGSSYDKFVQEKFNHNFDQLKDKMLKKSQRYQDELAKEIQKNQEMMNQAQPGDKQPFNQN